MTQSDLQKKPGFNFIALIKHAVVFLVLFLTLFIYFSPITFEGKTMNMHDVQHNRGAAKAIYEHRSEHQEEPLWTDAMFGGMPTYAISTLYPSNWVPKVDKMLKLGLPYPLNIFFGLFLGFYILMVVLKVDPLIAGIGAFAYTFSSYFFIIAQVGHTSKLNALIYLAPILAGVILTLRGRYLIGAAITAIAVALEVNARHPQVTYYFLLALGIYLLVHFWIAFLKPMKDKDAPDDGRAQWFTASVDRLFLLSSLLGPVIFGLVYPKRFVHALKKNITLKNKDLNRYVIGGLVLLICAVVGFGPNISKMWSIYEYTKHTNRGPAILQTDNQADAGGTDLEYAMRWSYGVNETFTLMIPNFMGGSSQNKIGKKTKTYEWAEGHFSRAMGPVRGKQQAAEFVKHAPTYWGDQPFTSGPVYVGAIICMLFLLGALLAKGPVRWFSLGAFVLSLILSWGRNAMLFTEFFWYNVPMYNRFRAPAMILIIAEMVMPLLAVLSLDRIFKANKEELGSRKVFLSVIISVAVAGGLSFIIAGVGPGMLSLNNIDTQYGQDGNLPAPLLEALQTDRGALLRSDAIRSLMLILIAGALIFFRIKQKLPSWVMVGGIALLMIIDLVPISTRYLNRTHFVSKEEFASSLEPTQVEKDRILVDKGDYRVFNVADNPFNESLTSHNHQSVGGYSAVKLRRYQDLIERHIGKNNISVLNMLNTKYIITKDQAGSKVVQQNPGALGNAWFVQQIKWVNTPDEEINGLTGLNAATTAVIMKNDPEWGNFQATLQGFKPEYDSTATIKKLPGKMNHLTYETHTAKPQLAVLSEVWYPLGWEASIDGKPVDYLRVNYALRGIKVPAGDHKVEFKFQPESYIKGEKISGKFSAVLMFGFVFLCIGEVALTFLRKRKKDAAPVEEQVSEEKE